MASRLQPTMPSPSAGLRRGFFGTPSPRAPTSLTPSPRHPGTPPTTSPFVHGPPPAPGTGSPRAGMVQSSPLASQAPPQVMVSDVRAPSVSRSPATPASPMSPAAPADMESIANLQMVWELVHAPAYRLPNAEAEGAWARACNTETALPELNRDELSQLDPEALASAIQKHARILAEAAFWDNVRQRLLQGLMGDTLVNEVSSLLSELGSEFGEIISDAATRQALQAEFNSPAIHDALCINGTASRVVLQPLAQLLQRVAQLLLTSGAPAREVEARQVQARFAAELGSAMTAAFPLLPPATAGDALAPEVQHLAVCIARVLRVLLAQLKLLKVDAANGRLLMLSQQVKGDAGIAYLRSKFSALHSLPDLWVSSSLEEATTAANEPVAAVYRDRLPRTTAWLQHAAAATPAIQQYLLSVGLDMASPQVQAAAAAAAANATAAAAAAAVQSVTLRSGLRSTASPGAATTPAGAAGDAPSAGHTLTPCMMSSWHGLLRTGVIVLVSSDKPAVSPALAETLGWDAERLHAAQNAFQQLVVLTAGMLLVQQTRARAGRTPLLPAQVDAARRRLLVVLADPGMSLSALVSELHRLSTIPAVPSTPSPATPAAASTGTGTDMADQVAEEAALSAAFKVLMNPASAAFTSISNAMAGALAVHLTLGSAAVTSPAAEQDAAAGGVARAVSVLLGRVGAAPLSADVAQLASQLAVMCKMSERVFGPLYATMAPSVDRE